MELREALSQIAEIRQQVAGASMFRGYRAATTAFSGVIALVAAALQQRLIPRPTEHALAYLALWLSAALLSVVVFAVELVIRHRRTKLEFEREITLLAIGQFCPCLIAGAGLTVVLARFIPEELWMLPGLWAILFSLGIFASRRLLPPAVFWSAAFYLLAGLICLAVAQGPHALSPWTMGLTFGVGQFLSAFLLYWNLERAHGQTE